LKAPILRFRGDHDPKRGPEKCSAGWIAAADVTDYRGPLIANCNRQLNPMAKVQEPRSIKVSGILGRIGPAGAVDLPTFRSDTNG